MQVNSATAAQSSVTIAASKSTAPTLGYDQFLQLLIAQLKNQDPTAPADSTQFVSQLATFSGVEQSVQANAKLDKILGATSIAQAQSLIGRTLSSADGATSGVVSAVDTNPDAPVATLADGTTMALAAGVRIS